MSYVYRELNVNDIKALLYFKNILIALCKYMHDTISTTKAPTMNIVLDTKNILKFYKHFDTKMYIHVAIHLCRILKINIFDFHNLRHFVLYLFKTYEFK